MRGRNNKILFWTVFPFLFAMTALACANSGDTKSSRSVSDQPSDEPQVSSRQFSDVQNNEWLLEEVKIGSETIRINRTANPDSSRAIYSIKFEDGRLGGTAAPNTYSAPYTLGEGSSLAVGMAVSTMMAPLFEPEGLKESDFLLYLSNISAWNLTGEKLELSTKDNNGREAALIWGKSAL